MLRASETDKHTWRLEGVEAPGEPVLLRDRIYADELTELEVTLGARPFDRYEVTPEPGADRAARELYEAWLREPLP